MDADQPETGQQPLERRARRLRPPPAIEIEVWGNQHGNVGQSIRCGDPGMKVIHPEVEPPIVVTLLLPYPPSRDPTAEEGVFPEQVPCDDCWRLHAGEVGEGIGHCRQQVRRRRHLERSSSNPEKARCPQACTHLGISEVEQIMELLSEWGIRHPVA